MLYPAHDGRVADGDISLGHHGRQVAIAQVVREVPADAQLNEFWGVATPKINVVAGGRLGHSGLRLESPSIGSAVNAPEPIPLLFLSGFAFPVESIPHPVVWLSYLLPSTHGIQAMLKFNQMGASWHEARFEVLRLLFVTAAYVALAWILARRRAGGQRSQAIAMAECA